MDKIRIADGWTITGVKEKTVSIFEKVIYFFNCYQRGTKGELGTDIRIIIFAISEELAKLHEKLAHRQIVVTCDICGAEVELRPNGEEMYEHRVMRKPICSNVKEFHIVCGKKE